MKIAFSSDRILEGVVGKLDVLVLVENTIAEEYADADIDVCIFENSNINTLYKLKKVKSAVSCGMGISDSVTFSSISEGSSLVCVRRRIAFHNSVIEPCEFKAPFFHNIDVYSNLALSLIGYLLKFDL